MNNNLLTICCTRGRPERAKEMHASFLVTSTLSNIMFCFDRDDPSAYDPMIMKEKYIIGSDITTTQLINMAFDMYPGYGFYSITNDDVIYETDGWDMFLMNKGKISYGDDKCQGEKMPTISVIDGDICRALGWLQMPTLTHLYGDAVWKAIGERLGILHFDKNVITNHKHFLYNTKVDKDEIYTKTNARDMYVKDGLAFEEWVRNDMVEDCEKIRRAICHK